MLNTSFISISYLGYTDAYVVLPELLEVCFNIF